jgi:hypothetical protein
MGALRVELGTVTIESTSNVAGCSRCSVRAEAEDGAAIDVRVDA